MLQLNIKKLQNRVLDQILVIYSIFAVFIYPFIVFREIKFGYFYYIFLATIPTLILVIVTLFRKKIPIQTKVYWLVIASLISVTMRFDQLGFLSSAKVYILVIPVFLTFISSYKKALFILLLFMLIYIFFGVLNVTGIRRPVVDPSAYISNYLPWTLECLIVFLSCFGLLYIGKAFGESISQSFEELKLHRTKLETLVREKTEELEESNLQLKSSNQILNEKNEIINKQNAELNEILQNLKSAQAQLLHAEKMASLGVLTAGISHEINNPLQYLSGIHYGFENYFKKHGTADEETTNLLLSSTETAIRRISTIVKGLSQFSRDNEQYDEECDIHAIIDNCLIMLHSQILQSTHIEKKFYPEKLTAKGNVGKLHQVFMNIINNAAQAIESEGTISIETKQVNGDIQIEISDTGCGISEENLSKIFDPFFTTKSPGIGTGLGLSITYSIIKEHSGQIYIQSEVNKGTKITVILPSYTNQR